MSRLNVPSKLIHRLDRVWSEQIFVIQVIEEDVQPLLSVCDVGLEIGWSPGLYALHVGIEDLVDGSRCLGDVRPIAGRYHFISITDIDRETRLTIFRCRRSGLLGCSSTRP